MVNYKVILLVLYLDINIIVICQGMDFLYNNNLINQIVEKLFKHKRNDYPEEGLQYLLYLSDIEHELHHVVNSKQQKLYTSLFKRSQKPQICIIYMHGYGSNRLQCANVIQVLPQNCALCSFDFSGSGKSEGNSTTYGIRQKQDINSIMSYLRKLGYKRFILWGRSMGATSALLYSLKYQPQDIILQIIDSPFYSFQIIAFQIANRNVKAPEFIISFALQMAKKNCQKMQDNPFSIELNNIGECQIPTLFVYHQEDNVINCQNTHQICSKFQGVFQKLAIEQNHNTARSINTIYEIFNFIDKYYKKYKQQKINCQPQTYPNSSRKQFLTPQSSRSKANSSFYSNEKSKSRKGIQRINNQSSTIKFQHYGMPFVDNKLGGSPQSKYPKRKYESCKRSHLNFIGQSKNKKQIELNLTSLMQQSKQTNQAFEFSIKIISPKKQKRKISTVKSLGLSRYQGQP